MVRKKQEREEKEKEKKVRAKNTKKSQKQTKRATSPVDTPDLVSTFANLEVEDDNGVFSQEIEDSFWVCCDQCDKWFCCSCHQLSKDSVPEKFFCMKCV